MTQLKMKLCPDEKITREQGIKDAMEAFSIKSQASSGLTKQEKKKNEYREKYRREKENESPKPI